MPYDIEAYFETHSEEEEEYIEELARLESEKGPIDYPEDWPMYDTKVG